MQTIDTVKHLSPTDEMNALLREKDLYMEHQQPFDFLHLVIIRDAKGRHLWSCRRTDVQALADEVLTFLRNH